MQTIGKRSLVSILTVLSIHAATSAPALPGFDRRAGAVKTLDTPRKFPAIESKSEWERRAEGIREQVLVSCGLWPMPEKTALNATIFGRIERDGYSVEKVYFESYPGFFVGGNLYRPIGPQGPFPGVLNPHGHWTKGRLEDGPDGSTPVRCISLARQGMVAFSWDMVGYNDTQFAHPAGDPGYKMHRHFANDPTNQLWNISQMGLQLWNSIRALDFLCSLPDVDVKRIACTGESGGGTQTFMLGAVDERLAAQAPVVMVSHSMQGGCSCENAPALRVDYSNMEIAAAAAPRPQLFVAATGDWTKSTLTIEGPAVAGIYKLFQASDRFRYVRFDFNHNYNKTSREAVYGWFSQCLLHKTGSAAVTEQPCQKEPDSDLRVFPDENRPARAVSEEQLTHYLIETAKDHWQKAKPVIPVLLRRYREEMLPAWKRNLQVDFPEGRVIVEPGRAVQTPEFAASAISIGREQKGDRIPVVLLTPRQDPLRFLTILVHPTGMQAYWDGDRPKALARKLIDRGIAVLLLDTFGTGEAARPQQPADYFKNFYTTYNRTEIQERVQDIVTACVFAQAHGKGREVVLCGIGRSGLWTLLASPAANGVVADCAEFDSANDSAFLARDIFSPGLRKMGGFQGVAAMAAANPLLLHHTGGKFDTAYLRDAYHSSGGRYREMQNMLSEEDMAEWIAGLRRR